MSTTEALKDEEKHWEFWESVIISSEITFMFGLNKFHWMAKTCALIWTLFPSTSSGLTLLWPFWSRPLYPGLMVPGYRQVSSRRKDLFCSSGSLSQGMGGGGGSTTYLWYWSDHSREIRMLLLWAALSARCAHLLSPSIINPSTLALNQHN